MITSVVPALSKVGQNVTFTLRATDPDSMFSDSGIWCNGGGVSFGDGGAGMVCIADCTGPGFGTCDPPEPKPSDLTFHSDHTYLRAGTFDVNITVEADVCGVRPSPASASTTVPVVGR